MKLISLVGSYAGQLRDFPTDIGLSLLESGRAVRPEDYATRKKRKGKRETATVRRGEKGTSG